MPDQDPQIAEPDDVTLMQRVAAGDEAAFEILVERHQLRVIGTITKMLGDVTTAEDLAQQVFVRVWQSAARYQPTAKFTTWLFTITRNLVFNESRRLQRAGFVPMEHEDGTPREFHDSSARDASEFFKEKELQAAIDQAIASLPDPQKVAIILRRYEEMPYEEIAVVLKTSVSAVKSLLFRAREDLKIKLKPFLSEE